MKHVCASMACCRHNASARAGLWNKQKQYIKICALTRSRSLFNVGDGAPLLKRSLLSMHLYSETRLQHEHAMLSSSEFAAGEAPSLLHYTSYNHY